MTRQTANDAFGRWPGILSALGIGSDFLKDEHGPCPKCSGRDRFRFDDKGTGSFFCSRCGAGDGFDLLRLVHGWDFQKAASEVDRVIGTGVPKTEPKPERTEEDKRKYMGELWRGSRPVVQGDPVWLYLERRCGASPAPYIQELRYHPSLKHSVDGGEHPAMLAMMGWDGRRYHGVHRTYLTLDGQKASVEPVRMSLGELGAVRLAPSGPVLGIAEGIETALCASRIFGIPVWAATCANAMESWVPPATVQRVVVMGDNDASYTGQAAAYTLARKLRVKGLEVEIQIPAMVGSDWADFAHSEIISA